MIISFYIIILTQLLIKVWTFKLNTIPRFTSTDVCLRKHDCNRSNKEQNLNSLLQLEAKWLKIEFKWRVKLLHV